MLVSWFQIHLFSLKLVWWPEKIPSLWITYFPLKSRFIPPNEIKYHPFELRISHQNHTLSRQIKYHPFTLQIVFLTHMVWGKLYLSVGSNLIQMGKILKPWWFFTSCQIIIKKKSTITIQYSNSIWKNVHSPISKISNHKQMRLFLVSNSSF